MVIDPITGLPIPGSGPDDVTAADLDQRDPRYPYRPPTTLGGEPSVVPGDPGPAMVSNGFGGTVPRPPTPYEAARAEAEASMAAGLPPGTPPGGAPPPAQSAPPPGPGPGGAPPSAAAGPAGPALPAVPAPQQVTSTQTSERTVLSPESKAALEQANAASGAQMSAAQRLAAAKDAQTGGQAQDMRDAARQASIDAKQAEMADTQRQLERARYQEATAQAEEKIKAAQARADADFEKSQKSYWADKSTGFKILSAILEGAATRNSYTLGEDPNNNPVARTIREAVEGDKAKKLAAYKRSTEYLAEARKGPEAARHAMMDAIDDINAVAASALDVSLKKASALSASRKLDPQRLGAIIEATKAQNANDLAETTASIAQRKLAENAVTNRKVENKIVTVKGEGADKASRSRTAEMSNAIYGTGVRDAIRDARAVKLSPSQMSDAIAKVQQNETSLKAVDQSHGVSGVIGTNVGRAVGIVPKGRLDGLSAAQQKFINHLDVAAKKTATIIAGQGHANAHEMMESFLPRNGDSPELIRQKLEEMDVFGAKAEALGGTSTGKAQRAGAAVRAGGEPAAADPYAGASVPQLRKALAAAAKAKDSAGVSDLRAALAAKGEK